MRCAGFSESDYDPGEWVELLDEFAMVAKRMAEWQGVEKELVYRKGTAARIKELLLANNALVERRRVATRALGDIMNKCRTITMAHTVAEAALLQDEKAGSNEA